MIRNRKVWGTIVCLHYHRDRRCGREGRETGREILHAYSFLGLHAYLRDKGAVKRIRSYLNIIKITQILSAFALHVISPNRPQPQPRLYQSTTSRSVLRHVRRGGSETTLREEREQRQQEKDRAEVEKREMDAALQSARLEIKRYAKRVAELERRVLDAEK